MLKNKHFWLLIPALLLRLVLASFFYHPDLKSQHYHASFLSRGVGNIYAFLDQNRNSLPYRDTFNYPPLIYYLQGSWQILARTVAGPGLVDWLGDWGPADLPPDIYTYLLVLKLPYLLTDLGLLYLLRLLVPAKIRPAVSLLWLFNPLSLYAVYMVGQFDILPALLTVSALGLARRNRLVWAALTLGIGAGLKTYPLLLLPFILFRARTPAAGLKIAFIFLAAWFLPFLPFISTPAFIVSTFQSGLGGRIFAAGVEIVSGQKLLFFPAAYGLLLVLSWLRRTDPDVLPEFLATTLGLLVFSHFHAQWGLWALPFLILWITGRGRALWWLAAIWLAALFTLVLVLPDQFVLLGLFMPLNPYLITIPSLSALALSAGTDLSLPVSLARTAFIVSAAFISARSAGTKPLSHEL